MKLKKIFDSATVFYLQFFETLHRVEFFQIVVLN